RNNKLTIEDFQGTTISLTNPGTIGTVHSVPRLMPGQGTIIGVGAMEYPAEFAGASDATLARMGISKVMTLTSTYDHRIIQRARHLRRGVRGAAHAVRAGARGAGPPRLPPAPRRPGRPLARADPRPPGPGPPDGRHRPAGGPAAPPPRPRHPQARAHPVGPG